jgi:hypothetical protein
MVRAILREIEQPGTGKTQTRRVLNPQPLQWQARVIDVLPPSQNEDGEWGQVETVWSGPLVPGMCEPDHEEWHPLRGVRYRIGDRLYVRETWAPLGALTHSDPGVQALADRGFYRADESTVEGEISRWRPGIHMPRWASRITLIVTDVRVQQLQEISEEDARAEGCIPDDDSLNPNHIGPARSIFHNLWDSLNSDRGYGWEANPWVAAYTFQPIAGNIDQIAGAA